MARLQALAEARLPATRIATVLTVDFGQHMSQHEVARVLETGEPPRKWRKLTSSRRTA